jgi:LemA protein
MSLPLILGLVGLGLVIYFISVYNQFQTLLTRIKASIQEIGNQLKRQADLIPNLEASVKGYLTHEKGILTLLADARKLVSKGQDASAKVAEFLPKLQVVVESNPQLKGVDVVSQLMDELRDTADKIMYSRRTLIDLSADYNQRVITFPTNLVARLFNFSKQSGLATPEFGDHLTVKPEEMSTPRVSL